MIISIDATAVVSKDSINIMCVAGEASGDLYGARLVRQLQTALPNARFYGMGMRRMRKAGVDLLVNAADIAVVGLFEVIPHLAKIRRGFNTLKNSIKDSPPDLLIVIDTPEIGLRLARIAKAHECPVLYYISPTIWAWRPGRIKTIRQCVDAMATIFPFEEALYRDAGVPVRYVGHPLVSEIQSQNLPERETFDEDEDVVLLMPGSRHSEIQRILPVMCAAAQNLKAVHAKPTRFTLLVAPDIDGDELDRKVKSYGLDHCELRHDTYPAMREAALAITASGTANLQLALCATPMVVVYRMNPLTYQIAKRLVRTPFISIVNILAGTELVPELIQGRANAEEICRSAAIMLHGRESWYRKALHRDFERIAKLLGDADATQNTTAMAQELLAANNKL